MKEQLVSFKTAKLAKDKGFNWKVSLHYESNGNCFFDKVECNFNNVELICSAPTQSLLQKWLREVHNIHITVTSISQESWQYHIQKPKDKLGDNYNEDYENYEEALEDGLQEALKLIK